MVPSFTGRMASVRELRVAACELMATPRLLFVGLLHYRVIGVNENIGVDGLVARLRT